MTKSVPSIHSKESQKQKIKAQLKKNCKNKKVFDSMEQAQQRARHLNLKGIHLKAYECGVCKKFHLTKRSPKSILEELFKKIEIERKNKKSSRN